jgi:hypothetical protein
MLGSAEMIIFACAGPWGQAGPWEQESAASSTVQVEVLVHSSAMIMIWHVTLEVWLEPTQKLSQKPIIRECMWEGFQTWKGRQFSCDPTDQKIWGSLLWIHQWLAKGSASPWPTSAVTCPKGLLKAWIVCPPTVPDAAEAVESAAIAGA